MRPDLRTSCGVLRVSDDFARAQPAQNRPTASVLCASLGVTVFELQSFLKSLIL
jgi:hypothetical protein